MTVIIELVQHSHVFAVAKQPVDGWKVLTLSQFLIKTPKHLRDKSRRKLHCTEGL